MIPNRSIALLASAMLFSLGSLVLDGCGPSEKERLRAEGEDPEGRHIVPVEVARAERKTLAVTNSYSGTLEGEEQANIVAKLSERITAIHVRVGQAVRAGEVIISLDKSGASSQYYQAEANFKNAEKTLARMKSLYDEGAISLQTLDGVQTAFDVAEANFASARSTVELSTPIAGAVTAVTASNGDLAVPGSILATVATIGRMKVTFSVSENDVPSLSVGQKVEVYSETRPEAVVNGTIIQLAKSADILSRSFELKAIFPNTRDRWFKPGMFCRVNVQLAPRAGVLVIPNAAIQSDGATNRVFVVRQGRAFERVVQLGVTDGKDREILRGLAEFDTVATVGVTTLRDSGFVSVVRPSR